MNRKAEGITNLVAITRARIRGDLAALGALGKSLEDLTHNEYDTMELSDWSHAKDTAQKAQEDSTACLRALGALPPFIPRPGDSSVFGAGVTKGPAPRAKQRRPNAIRHPAPGGKGAGS